MDGWNTASFERPQTSTHERNPQKDSREERNAMEFAVRLKNSFNGFPMFYVVFYQLCIFLVRNSLKAIYFRSRIPILPLVGRTKRNAKRTEEN